MNILPNRNASQPRRYNRFAVLACLSSVWNCSRSLAFVCQSVIAALLPDASTPSCYLNVGLPRHLVFVYGLKRLYGLGRPFPCVQHGQPNGEWWAWYAVRQWSRRTSRIARHYSGSSIVLPYIRGQVSFWASFSRTRLRGFRQSWTVSMSQRRMWVPVLYKLFNTLTNI